MSFAVSMNLEAIFSINHLTLVRFNYFMKATSKRLKIITNVTKQNFPKKAQIRAPYDDNRLTCY